MRPMFSLLFLFWVCSANAAEWKQWRGPNHDGVSTETDLLDAWGAAGPELCWKVEHLGGGFSNLSFSDNRIFSLGDREEGCVLYALEQSSGKEIWTLRIGPAGASPGNSFSGPRCTPATDGHLVFALGQFGDFVCADAQTGKECWRVNVAEKYGGFVAKSGRSNLHWDFSMSPIIDGNRIVLPIGGEGGTVIAFEKSKEGPKLLWRSEEISEGAAYTSIIPFSLAGKHQYLLLTTNHLCGINPENGTLLWQAGFPGNVAVCSDPVLWRENENTCYIMASSGYGVGARGYKVSFQEGKFEIQEVWTAPRLESHHGGMVQVDGYFYLLTQRALVCVTPKTGEILWQDRSVGKGSILAADGKLIVRSELAEGTVALVEATPKGYNEISRFDQPDRTAKSSWTYPVIYEGKLYLRDQGLLLCYEMKR